MSDQQIISSESVVKPDVKPRPSSSRNGNKRPTAIGPDVAVAVTIGSSLRAIDLGEGWRDVRPSRDSFESRLGYYLKSNPHLGDVIFKVGPQQEVIRSFRLPLIVESPVFEKLFQTTWDCSSKEPGDPICLPDTEPDSFRVFLRLLLEDHFVAFEFSKNIQLKGQLNLMALCQQFQVASLKKIITPAVGGILRNFADIMGTEEFFGLSSEALANLLKWDEIHLTEIEIFKGIYKWAEHQCEKDGMEKCGANFRKVLGDTLASIRFPLVSWEDFGGIVVPTKILTEEEMLTNFLYLSSDPSKRESTSKARGSEQLDVPTEPPSTPTTLKPKSPFQRASFRFSRRSKNTPPPTSSSLDPSKSKE